MRPISSMHALLLAALAPALVLTAACRPDKAADHDAPTARVPVHACRAKRTTLRPTVDLVGTIVAVPERSASISSRIAGWIQEVSVTEGQTVQAGRELIRLDDRVGQADLEKAQALLSETEAVLARLRHGYLPQEIEAARADVEQAKAKAVTLRRQLQAAKPLHQRHEISNVQYEKLASELQAAEASTAAAEAKLKLLEAGTRPEQIAESEAQVAAAKADLHSAELAVEFCTIKSPIAGRLTRLSARQGMFVERAATLATVTDLSAVFAQVRIPNVYQMKVPARADAVIFSAATPGKVFRGKLARTGGRADPQTGDVDAFIQVPNEHGLLQPGFACHAKLSLREIENALVVPVAAIADRDGVPVLTVVRDGKAYEIEVALGKKTRDFVQITKGLKAGDMVATEGGYGLPDGCPVKIVPESAPHEKGKRANLRFDRRRPFLYGHQWDQTCRPGLHMH